MATALVMVLGLAVTPARPASADSLYVISGTVFGGERPRAGVFVSDGQRTIVTDASGAFEFERSAPGVVFVSAWLSNGSTRTWVVVLAVPGETVIEFSFPHSLALRGPGLWDPMSTAAGPITRTLRIVTDAPDPTSASARRGPTKRLPPRIRTLIGASPLALLIRRQQPLQRRDYKGRGLACAGFRAGNQIVARESERNHRALDRPCFAETEIADAFKQSRVEAERGERHGRRVAGRGFESRRL